jgi:hypothetical protein
MAFMRTKFGDDLPTGKLDRTSSTPSTIVRWVAIPGAGVALSLWIVAGMAGAYSASSSLSSTTTFMPRMPREANLGTTIKAEKAQRLIAVAAAGSDGHAHSATVSSGERFEAVVASAALSPQKLAAAFAKSGMVVAKHQPAQTSPLKERFDVAAAVDPHGPMQARFGQRSETERSSRLALALAGSAGVELAYAVAATPDQQTPFSSLFVSPENMLGTDEGDDVAVFDDLPDNIPLPARRPKIDDSPADRPEKAPAPRVASTPKEPVSPKPTKRDRNGGEMLAFAKPDNPRESGGLFSSLFSRSTPKARAGVAVYDIAAATVTMPDGTKLEAHSGIGKMADNARYADEQMRGPTPPGTYKLSMRESLFHGVEAIRMTPVSGNTYGRTGFLAHTELLRGRPEQSHGCVAFKDYKRFLQAFKRGHITRMVVVPGRSRRSVPATTVADNGRGA